MSIECITCKTWKRRGSELIGICSNPQSVHNCDHPSNKEMREYLSVAGEDLGRFFWTAEDYGCELHEH